MRALLITVVLGVLAFVTVAVAQEWSVFATALSGKPARPPVAEPAAEAAARVAVRRFLILTGHLYSSGFDRRFAERLPASASVIEELQAEMDYLSHRGRLQLSQLERLQFLATRMLGPDRLELVTEERWITRARQRGSTGPATPPRSSSHRCRYHLKQEGTRWIVEGWDLDPAAPVRAER